MRRLLFAAALAMHLAGCGLSSVRTSETSDGEPSATRGRQILETALEASGGQAAWDARSFAEMELRDEWRGLVGRLFRPWPEDPTLLRMRFELGMRSAEAEFLSGRLSGVRWGRDEQGAWRQDPGGVRDDSKHEKARFILAAYQYFFELPRRILDAPITLYAGQRELDGRSYDLVFATWKSAESHGEDDQYLLWVARDTHLIEIAQYTIRDKLPFATGINFFSDFRRVDGLTIPHAYRITRRLDDESFVHRVQIEDLSFTLGTGRRQIAP